ncbi:double homeobox protein 4-like protein 2 [Bos javanicus]|uniref:double homeobox protein 4-like protein 2 n=1 Tax=Bos javanicus TaxID=9906 RepID=UPI002AA75FA0|nr:double homeobox protein 4-like protein 2 [Bos javanicus]
MASSGSSSTSRGPIATGSRRRRLVLKPSQKDALQALFQQNPYPGIATRERLARELGVDESRVQAPAARAALAEDHASGHSAARPEEERDTQGHACVGSGVCAVNAPRALTSSPLGVFLSLVEDSAREARRKRTVISPSQTRILVQAFTRDRFRGLPPGRNWLVRRESQNLASRYGFKTEELGTPSGAQAGPPQESMPPLAAAAPFGAPTFWVPGAASGVCVGQPLMIFVVQPSPAALQPSGRPPPPPQGAAPWAACSPAVTAPGQPGQGAILPPGQPETHIPRWPESPYGEGTAPPLEPQPQAPSLPSSTSLLDELLAATGVPGTQAPSPGAAADEGVGPALPGAPSFLDELLAATGTPDTPGPSLGPSADERAHLALPGELPAAAGLPGSPGPSPGSSPVVAGPHPALPGPPSLLEEILAATAIQDTPWSSPGSPAGEEGVEATLETPLSEDEERKEGATFSP